MGNPLKPPFELSSDKCGIFDHGGHLLTAENPEIAQALLALLNRTMIPASPEPPPPPDTRGTSRTGGFSVQPKLTPERVLDWVELSVLRVRDSERKRSVSHDPAVRILTEICEHIAAFRKEFKDHG